MKTKLLSLASMLAAFNLNAIELGPTGSGVEMSGFADYSAANDPYTPGNSGAVSTVEVELMLDFTSGPVSFSTDIDFETGGANLEEAVVTYSFNDNLSMSVGHMLSYLGFEAYDAPNMYQFSYAYDYASSGGQDIYDPFATGVSLDYGADDFSVGVWTDFAEKPSYEYAFAYTGIENFTAKAIFADYGNDADEIMTLWASYQVGNLLIGAEYATDDKNTAAPNTPGYGDDDIDAYLIMGNYALTDSAAVTVRYSSAEYTDAATVTVDKFTISPSYTFTDDLAGLIEYSTYSVDAGATEPEDLFAFELIYTF